jgi:spermidine synthase
MSSFKSKILFALFFVSGFSGLVYQVVWTRMAFASFGIITPVLSVVISVFMLGLSLGAWLGGRWIGWLTRKTSASAIFFYALTELMIALGAFAVPKLFALGEQLLLASGETDSFGYLSLSALVLFLSILPWCFFMGATFPLMMAYIREQNLKSAQSFSFLYLANVLGAMMGAILTALVFVELFGFQKTLWIAAAGNFLIALTSIWLGRTSSVVAPLLVEPDELAGPPAETVGPADPGWLIKTILFSTGFSAMAMEVVWARAFTPVLSTQVYAFALIVFAYLGATFAGSLWYRHDLRKGRSRSLASLISLATVTAILPVLINDPRVVNMTSRIEIDLPGAILALLSISPLCAALGYLTPALIDNYARGHPAKAGKVYALNVLGCILGPLVASYLLLPRMSERNALILLAIPFFAFYLLFAKRLPFWQRSMWGLAAGLALAFGLFLSWNFETLVLALEPNVTVRRDYAATVISSGEGMKKRLLVNSIGMTALTPITKFMSHLPMALHNSKPESVLIVCFGMGTTYRSALSWNVDTTAVELVPSVTKAFGFYHDDAGQVIANPLGRIIIDDGRRFLKRTSAKYDVIVVDPPPPIEAAGSSLLYSREFYDVVKQHMKPNAILQAWFPRGDPRTAQAVLRSLHESFPYLRGFPSLEGWGCHFLASMERIDLPNTDELMSRMPEAAKQDLLEWAWFTPLRVYLEKVVSYELPLPKSLNPDKSIRITDDRPYNEYYLMRRLRR